MSALFDGYRVDHVVGFYRTYVWPAVGPAYFLPAEQADQLAQGERLMRIFLDSGARITAEDLGTVPPFVRASIGRLGLAGYRVLRWEREWDRPGSPFRNPASYPRTSVATTGTHDTEPLAEWWESTSSEERLTRWLAGTAGPPGVERRALDVTTRDRLLELLYASGSDLLVLPCRTVRMARSRQPASTVSKPNWTYRLRWAVVG
jgi:4-alpha-glucanotransferase